MHRYWKHTANIKTAHHGFSRPVLSKRLLCFLNWLQRSSFLSKIKALFLCILRKLNQPVILHCYWFLQNATIQAAHSSGVFQDCHELSTHDMMDTGCKNNSAASFLFPWKNNVFEWERKMMGIYLMVNSNHSFTGRNEHMSTSVLSQSLINGMHQEIPYGVMENKTSDIQVSIDHVNFRPHPLLFSHDCKIFWLKNILLKPKIIQNVLQFGIKSLQCQIGMGYWAVACRK